MKQVRTDINSIFFCDKVITLLPLYITLVVHVHLPLCKSFTSFRGRPLYELNRKVIPRLSEIFLGNNYIDIIEV